MNKKDKIALNMAIAKISENTKPLDAYDKGFERGKEIGELECLIKYGHENITHAHWIFNGEEFEFIDCSNCGESRNSFDKNHRTDIPNFCPNCGAKMDEEASNDN